MLIQVRFYLCPETGGKTLEQVDYLFTKEALAFKSLDLEDVENGTEKASADRVEVERVQ